MEYDRPSLIINPFCFSEEIFCFLYMLGSDLLMYGLDGSLAWNMGGPGMNQNHLLSGLIFGPCAETVLMS